MKSVLVVYATTEGQTRKIAEFIAQVLHARGVKADLVDSASESAAQVQPVYSAAILCGSIHQHGYHATLMRFVNRNKDWLGGLPAAFVSVSLTALLQDDKSRDELRTIAEAFFRATGWSPAITRHVAGALRYTEYEYFKRLIMRLIARHQGGDTDTSRRPAAGVGALADQRGNAVRSRQLRCAARRRGDIDQQHHRESS